MAVAPDSEEEDREEAQAKGGRGEAGHGLFTSCLHCLAVLRCGWCCGDFDACELTHEEELAMHSLSAAACIPFDTEDPKHEALLRQFYEEVVGSPDAPAADSERDWKALGFQSQNPRTDFRGGGLLALQQLLFFARHFHEQMVILVEKSKRDRFPLAASLINVTHVLGIFFNLYSDNHLVAGTSDAALTASPRCLKNFARLCASVNATKRGSRRLLRSLNFSFRSTASSAARLPRVQAAGWTGPDQERGSDWEPDEFARCGSMGGAGDASGLGAGPSRSDTLAASPCTLYVLNFLYACVVIRLDREIDKRKGWFHEEDAEKSPTGATGLSPPPATSVDPAALAAAALSQGSGASDSISRSASVFQGGEEAGEGGAGFAADDELRPLLDGASPAESEAGAGGSGKPSEPQEGAEREGKEAGEGQADAGTRATRGSIAALQTNIVKAGRDLAVSTKRALQGAEPGDELVRHGQRGSTIFVFAESLVACRVAVEELLSSGEVHKVTDLLRLTEEA
ncbi:ELMO/CED-12 family protein [Besnoitia besnoiti]|uniref:ELMO/CED-12 family protein n=1 Tax=Besnoitia besnoiti TaxID=94643 RepID=A0A2A9M1R5_BESBE|nr:ELMO/CED-12 family protein [Besnoitia besnoiti]PFH31184.1 ELMO/CED-12 family protein [Besnoitia besnoiti]